MKTAKRNFRTCRTQRMCVRWGVMCQLSGSKLDRTSALDRSPRRSRAKIAFMHSRREFAQTHKYRTTTRVTAVFSRAGTVTSIFACTRDTENAGSRERSLTSDACLHVKREPKSPHLGCFRFHISLCSRCTRVDLNARRKKS